MTLTALAQVSKAISATTAAATGLLTTAAVQDGVSTVELAIVILGAIGTFFAAFIPRNAAPSGRRRSSGEEPAE